MNLADIEKAADLAKRRARWILEFNHLRSACHAPDGVLYGRISVAGGYLDVSVPLPREVVIEAALSRIDEVDRELMALGVHPEPFDRDITKPEGGAS